MRLALLCSIAMIVRASVDPTPAVINLPVVNMYGKPSADSNVVSQAIFGTNVQVLEDKTPWLKIRTADEYTGWIEASSVVKRDPYGSGGRVATVKNLFGSLYRETSITRHQPVHTLPFEARLEVIAEPETEDRRWIQVRLPDNREAWIQRGDVSIDPKTISREEMLAFSKRFAGLPYLWGGVSTFGYDCSGFVQMLYRQTGVNLPRDAQPQHDWGGMESIALSELAPGDLVFFGSSNKRITHIGMFIGSDEFIHATSHLTPIIQVSKLSGERWKKLLVATRRVK
jgi:SH3-like domain-containing protein